MKLTHNVNSIFEFLNILANMQTTTLNTLTRVTTTTTSGFSSAINGKTLFANSRLIYS